MSKPLFLDLPAAEARLRREMNRMTEYDTFYVGRSSWTKLVYIGKRTFSGPNEVDTSFLFNINEATARKLVGLGLVDDRTGTGEFS